MRPAEQPSNHRAPEKLLPTIPDNATQAYVRQHKKTGLQAPFDGPFDIEERLSRSTVKLHVGNLKDGTKKFEVRHVNDLKFAHPKSLASSIHRPSRGRPPQSVHPDLQQPTDELAQTNGAEGTPQNRFSPDPKPTNISTGPESKQSGTEERANHATSKQGRRESPIEPDAEWKPSGGPPPVAPFERRAPRSTRNPSPMYVDAIWTASQSELDQLNKDISRSRN